MTPKRPRVGQYRETDAGRLITWPTTVERFRSRHEVTSAGCWQWDVVHPQTGYGTIRDTARGKNVLAHRWSYEYHVGPIPEGLQIDHLCRNRGCVNPAHLEAVTPLINTRRGFWGTRTHCLYGHPLDGLTHDGYRFCHTCKTTRERLRRARQGAK